MQNHELGIDSDKICEDSTTKNTPNPYFNLFGSSAQTVQTFWDIFE